MNGLIMPCTKIKNHIIAGTILTGVRNEGYRLSIFTKEISAIENTLKIEFDFEFQHDIISLI